MKKVVKKLKQSLSILLAVAMVITCVPQTATLAYAASDTDVIDTEISTEAETPAESDESEISTDEPALVSDDADDEPADTTEQPDMADEDAAGDDEEVEQTEGGLTEEELTEEEVTEEGLEIQESPTLNLDKATNDSHTISFEADEEQVKVTDNAAAFVESEESGAAYTFKAAAETGYKITSISAYKDSTKIDGDNPWARVDPVAIWPKADDKGEITYDENSATYSIAQTLLALSVEKDGETKPESFTIVIESEKEKYDVTVTLEDTTQSNIASWTYSVGAAEAANGTFGTAIKVPYDDTLKIQLTPAANRTVTVKRDGTEVAADEAADGDAEGVLTYTFANITAATAITVSTVKTNREKYAVETSIKDGEGADSTDATVEYTNDCVAEGQIEEDTDLTFTVTPKDGYSVEVKYQIGETTSAAMRADEDGVYTIEAEKITFAEGTADADKKVTILVTVKAIEYEISFNLEQADGAAVKIKNTEGTFADYTAGSSVKVNFGDTVTFTVDPGESGEEGSKVSNKLRYVSTSKEGSDGVLEASEEDGVYTFTVGKDTQESTTIYVSASPLKDIAINFTGTEIKGVPQVDVSTVTTADGKDTLTAVTNNTVNAKEDDIVKFVVEPTATSKYFVKSVKLQGSEDELPSEQVTIGEGENAKTYTAYKLDLADAVEDKYVVITLELDKEKANVVNFTVSGNDIGDAYTITVENDDKEDGYHAGDELVTTESEIKFTIVPNASYYQLGDDITARWDGEAEDDSLYAGVDGKYTLTFDADNNKRVATVEVGASIQAAEAANTISFNKVSDNIYNYTVPETDNVTQKSGNIYELQAGTLTVKFTVNALENYTPVVSYQNAEGTKTDVAAPEAGNSTKVGKIDIYPYEYSIPAAAFGKDAVITIDAKAATKNIEVTYNVKEADVYVKQNGDVLYGEWIEEEPDSKNFTGATFEVPVNSDATLVIEPKENCEVTGAEYQIGDGASKNVTAKELKAGEIKLTKISDDTTVTITTKANYAVNVWNVNAEGNVDSLLEAVKGVYSTDYTGQYKISAVKGDNTPSPIAAVEVTQSKASEEDKAKMAVLSEDNNFVDLKFFEADAGQTVKLKLTFGEGESAEVKIVEFKVLSKITKLTIKGITLDRDGKGTLSQDADTKKEYPITLTPKTVNMEKLAVEILPEGKENPTEAEINAAKELLDAGIENGSLAVTTNPQKDKADAENLGKAVIRVVDKNLQADAAGYVKAEITVTITAPKALKDATPVVSVKSATDTTLTLSLGLDKKVKVENPVVGELWYQVTVTADANEGDSKLTEDEYKNITDAVGTFYIKKDAAATAQDATLKVSNAVLGSGKAWGYKLDVTLVQHVDSAELSTVDANLANSLMLTTVNAKASDTIIASAGTNTAFASQTKADITAATRTPYYETKLKLKKGKTTVYTGQQDVPIATIQYNNDTTYRMAIAEDVSNYGSLNSMVKLYVKDGTVYMSVDKSIEMTEGNITYDVYNAPITGSHTIRVTAVEPGQTYPVSADIKVTVVRGINRLYINPASNVVYRADGKAATLKVTPVYNSDFTGKDKTAQPKTKKLSYELVGNDSPYIKVNPSNGTVTIDKKYNLYKEDTTFKVKATAMDFDGNETFDVSDEITISNKALEIGRVEILRLEFNEENAITYNVVAKEGYNVTSDELTTGIVRAYAFKPGTPEKLSYTEEELYGEYGSGYMLDPYSNIVSFKSGNKAVQMDSYGLITGVSKVANNVAITATANDGGKKTKVMKFNVINAEPECLGLLVEQQNDEFSDYNEIFKDGVAAGTAAQHTVNVIGTANTVLRLSMVQKAEEEGDWQKAYQYANVKMTVSGGTVLQKADALNSNMLIVANKETITVTLENKGVKPSVKQTFTIKNNAAGTLTAYQKVTTSTKALAAYSNYGQEIKYQLNAKDKDKYAYEDAKDQLYVMIQPDAADRNKKSALYSALEECSSINGQRPVEKDGSFKIWFDEGYLPAGTYKLQLTFGKYDSDFASGTYGSFIAESKPQTVTVKINANKTKVTFKPVTALTMSLKDKASVTLTGSGKNYDMLTFYGLQNINGYGTSNDDEKFTTYFVLVSNDASNSYEIRLKNDLTPEQIAFITGSEKKAQNARTAYISYRAWNSNPEVAMEGVSGTVKITVKFTAIDRDGIAKPAASYSISSLAILEGNKNTAVSVTAAKKPANVLYAAVSESSDGFDIAVDEMNVNSDAFTLSSKDALAVNKSGYTVKVKVIPVGAHASLTGDIETAKNAYSAAAEGEAKNQAAEAYKNAILNSKAAIELTTKVKVLAKTDSTKKITIAASELKKDTWDYYAPDKNYWNHVYYTKATCNSDIKEVVASYKPADVAVYDGVVSFGEPDSDKNGLYFDISVDKEALANAEAKQQAANNKKHAYGATIEVTATVKYGKYETNDGKTELVLDEAVKEDVFKFKVTLPKKPETGSFTETLAKIEAELESGVLQEKIYASQDYPEFPRNCKGYPFGSDNGEEAGSANNIWYMMGPSDSVDWDEWYTEQVNSGKQNFADLYGYINSAIWHVHDTIEAMTPQDSETAIFMLQPDDNGDGIINIQPGQFAAPTGIADGKLVISVKLVNSTIITWTDDGIVIDSNYLNQEGYSKDLDIELRIPRLGEEPSDVKAILEAYRDETDRFAKNPSVEYEDVIKDITKAGSDFARAMALYPTLRFNIEEFKKEAATEEVDGVITGYLHVWGVKYGGEEVRVWFSFKIDKLDGMEDIESNIKVALGDKTAIASLSEDEKEEQVILVPTNRTTKEEIETIFKAAYANPMVEASWGELAEVPEGATDKSFVVKEATAPKDGSDGKGSIRCAIKLSKEGTEDVTFEVEIEIPALASAAEAVTAVKAAVIDEKDNELKVMSIITPIVSGHLKTIETEEALPSKLEETIVSEVKAAVLKAANDALTGQPYTVAYKQTGEGDNKADVFKFVPYTYKSDGTISYTLEVKALTKGLNGDSDAVVGDVVSDGELTLKSKDSDDNEITDVPVKKDPSLVTFVQAASEIKEALAAMEGLSNDTTSEEVRQAAEDALSALDDESGKATGITVSHKKTTDEDGNEAEDDDYTFTPATFTAKGKLEGTLVLERFAEESEEDDPDTERQPIKYEVAYTVELPVLVKNTEAVVKAEVERALKAVGATNDDAGEATAEGAATFKLLSEKETALVNKAKEVVADSGYEIALDEDTAKASTVTKATLNTTGSVKVSFVLTVPEGGEATLEGEEGSKGKFDVTITISKLSQTAKQLKEAITALLGEKYPDNKVELPSGKDAAGYLNDLSQEILNAVTDTKVKKDTWTVKWDDENALQVVNGEDDQPSGYAGTLNIFKGTDTTKRPVQTVEVSLTIATEEAGN